MMKERHYRRVMALICLVGALNSHNLPAGALCLVGALFFFCLSFTEIL